METAMRNGLYSYIGIYRGYIGIIQKNMETLFRVFSGFRF